MIVASLPLERSKIIAARYVVDDVRIVHKLRVRQLPKFGILILEAFFIAVLGDAEPPRGFSEHV